MSTRTKQNLAAVAITSLVIAVLVAIACLLTYRPDGLTF
jgi:hypothetical protein